MASQASRIGTPSTPSITSSSRGCCEGSNVPPSRAGAGPQLAGADHHLARASDDLLQPGRARALGEVDQAADVETRLEQPVKADTSKARLAAAPTRTYARPDAPAAAAPQLMERTLDPARLGDHLDRLYRAAWALCGSREEAEDLVQETYARVLARPRVLRNSDDLGYLLRALRNTFFNRRRAEGRRVRPAPLPDDL